MKTSLIVKDWNNRLERAALLGEAAADFHSILYHYPAHTAMISRGFGKPKPEHQKESVCIRNSRYLPKGGKLERIRKLPEAVVATLIQLDEKREELHTLMQEIRQVEVALLASVYEVSVPLKMTEVRGFKDLSAAKAK